MSDEPDYILEISTAAHADNHAPASAYSPDRGPYASPGPAPATPASTALASSHSGASGTSPRTEARPWIGVHFECCGVYARIYRQPDSPVYAGQCPRCLARITARVGADGTPQRLFRAS